MHVIGESLRASAMPSVSHGEREPLFMVKSGSSCAFFSPA